MTSNTTWRSGLTRLGLVGLVVAIVYLISLFIWVGGEVPRSSLQCSTHCGPIPASVAFASGLTVIPLLLANVALSVVVLILRRGWDRAVGIFGLAVALLPIFYFVIINLVN